MRLRPFRKGPVVTARQLEAQARRDRARVRSELRDRIDHAREVGVDFEAVLRTVAHAQPDAVRYALDEAGAPS